MKGIILAGGTGSRLFPLTKVTNKHLLPVGRVPMIYFPIRKLVQAGIEEILIVTGVENMGDVVNLLGSGREFNCRFTYKVQDEAGGIAQALALAENFSGSDQMVVLLGDNIFSGDITPYIKEFQQRDQGAMVLLKEVPDPGRYGVATVEQGVVRRIVEKPELPESNLAVTGIYLYDANVFDYIRQLEPSGRGELEITDVNNHYLESGNLYSAILTGWWTDAGTFESLAHANQLLQKQIDGANR
ncbi:MAG: NTP transferase domain-containing protein [Candidatus Delongbacteria bacterium]|nr:NTP transferase domain-containing protein [Candidatus Delongbacteria bacterium]